MTDIDDLLVPPWSRLPLVHDTTDLFPAETMTALSAQMAAQVAGAAPAQPLGRAIVLMGDSITAYNGGTSTAHPAQALSGYDSKGMWRWAQIMLGQRLDIIGNSGIGGQESSQIEARFDTDVLALNPQIVAILAGTNDDGSEDATQANLTAMYAAAAAARIFVVAFTIPPQTTGALATYRQGLNAWIRDYVRTHAGMLLVDLADLWQDHGAAGFVARSDYMHDETHPNTLGAQVAGFAIAQALSAVVGPPVKAASTDAAPDTMLANGRFAGTGTGVPTGWTLNSGAAAFAYVPGPNGRGQRLAVTVPFGGSAILIQNVNLGVLLRTNDEYDFTVTVEPYDLELAGASTQRISVYTQNYNGSTFSEPKNAVYVDGSATYSSARFPAESGVFRTERGVLTSGKTLMQSVIALFGGGTYLLSDAVARNLTMIDAGITAPENVPHTNLITNGEFETNTTGWSINGGAAIARVTTDKHSGAASLQITHAADVQSDARFQKVTGIDGTKLLNYVAWIKAPSGFLGRFNFNWYQVSGGSFISTQQTSFTGTGNWQKLIGTLSAATVPDNAAEMLLTVARADATGTPVVLVDDVDVWQ